MPPIRVAVIGAGAFGRNHLRVYRELQRAHPETVQLWAIVEPNPVTRAAAVAEYQVASFATPEDLLAVAPPDAASVCVPTVHHAAVAEVLLRAGVDVLIEKPFAATLAEADGILALANRHRRILQIGHLERFNPAVTATIQLLNRPMFFEAHRLSIFTPRSLDVDVVLDLMIHDLDIVLALTNSPVREVRAVGLPILSGKVDIANVRIEFNSGAVANFTASRVSTEQVRKIRMFQPRQYLSLDFARQEVLSIDVTTPSGAKHAAALAAAAFSGGTAVSSSGFAAPPPARPARTWSGMRRSAAAEVTPHPSAGLSLEKVNITKAEPLRLELEDFIRAVCHRTQPRVTGEAGLAALALALEINGQIAAHSHRAGLT